jgi:hypothetical protein
LTQLSPKLPWELAQTKWSSALNPVLALPILDGLQIDGIKLIANKAQAINHQLQRLPQGWFLVDNTANTVVWRTQAFNTLTLSLESSSDTTISIWVF